MKVKYKIKAIWLVITIALIPETKIWWMKLAIIYHKFMGAQYTDEKNKLNVRIAKLTEDKQIVNNKTP
jgi:hypothetical protein